MSNKICTHHNLEIEKEHDFCVKCRESLKASNRFLTKQFN